MRLITDGVVEREGVPGLACRLGYSERHVTRVLTAELGAGPLALARAHRAHSARLLIETTTVVAGRHRVRGGLRERPPVQRHDPRGLRDHPDGPAHRGEPPRNPDRAGQGDAAPALPRAIRLRQPAGLPGRTGNPRRRVHSGRLVRPHNAAGPRRRHGVADPSPRPHRLHAVADGHARPGQRGVPPTPPTGPGRRPRRGGRGAGRGPAAGGVRCGKTRAYAYRAR